MPPEARVAIIEDNGIIRTFEKKALEKEGHTVVAVAKTKEEAQLLLPRLSHLRVNVILMDGNLSEDDNSGRDGAELTKQAHELNAGITVLGVSGHPDGVVGADYNVNKVDVVLGDINLGKTVTDL